VKTISDCRQAHFPARSDFCREILADRPAIRHSNLALCN
jgi:hypothetical protein